VLDLITPNSALTAIIETPTLAVLTTQNCSGGDDAVRAANDGYLPAPNRPCAPRGPLDTVSAVPLPDKVPEYDAAAFAGEDGQRRFYEEHVLASRPAVIR
jgi:hypothetical protein